MNSRQVSALASYDRILTSLSQQPRIAPEMRVVFGRFQNTVAEIKRHGADQWGARKSFHVTKARHELDDMRSAQMLPLARVARRLFAGQTSIQDALRVPPKRAQNDAVLASAASMVKALKPQRATLTAAKIDATRLDRLLAEARRLKKIFAAANEMTADRAVPTRRLVELFAAAHADAETLDALIVGSQTKPEKVDREDIRRIPKRMGRPPKRARAAGRIRAVDR
jgi:hypothetical protein